MPGAPNYNPSDTDCNYFKEAYTEGYNACQSGTDGNSNPYTSSGHERETRFEDEAHYYWYRGWQDGYSDLTKQQKRQLKSVWNKDKTKRKRQQQKEDFEKRCKLHRGNIIKLIRFLRKNRHGLASDFLRENAETDSDSYRIFQRILGEKLAKLREIFVTKED